MKPTCCDDNQMSKEVSSVVKFLKIIAEENRIKILCMLREGEKCVCDIWQFLGLPQNLVSHHLKMLKDAKLIESRKEGLKVYYSINKSVALKYNSSLNRLLQSYEE